MVEADVLEGIDYAADYVVLLDCGPALYGHKYVLEVKFTKEVSSTESNAYC